MRIDNAFNIGQSVYLKTDTHQHERIVTGIALREFGLIYMVSLGESESNHYGFEMTADRDTMKALNFTPKEEY